MKTGVKGRWGRGGGGGGGGGEEGTRLMRTQNKYIQLRQISLMPRKRILRPKS